MHRSPTASTVARDKKKKKKCVRAMLVPLPYASLHYDGRGQPRFARDKARKLIDDAIHPVP